MRKEYPTCSNTPPIPAPAIRLKIWIPPNAAEDITVAQNILFRDDERFSRTKGSKTPLKANSSKSPIIKASSANTATYHFGSVI